MMNTVIWINDRKDNMDCIVRGSFPHLWEKGIISKAIFLGDAVFSDMNDFDAKLFSRQISDVLSVYYKKCKDRNTNIELDIKKLEQMYNYYDKNHPKDVFVLETSNEKIKPITDKWSGNTMYNELKNANKDPDKIKKYIEESVKDLFDNDESKDDIIPANVKNIYMLDIVLLKGDYEKLVVDDNNDPNVVISMALYYYITQILEAKCFLYSQHTYISKLQNNWTKLYMELFDDTDKNLKIIPRSQYYAGSLNMDCLNLIIQHFEAGGKA